MKTSKITIRNYRNIPYNNPLTLEIREGVTFILGANNIGKSNLIKFFYELRGLISDQNKITSVNPNNFKDGLRFASLKNQKSISNKIEIKMETDFTTYALKLLPHIDEDNSYYNVKYEAMPKSIGPTPKDDLDVFGLIFSESMYIGSFRTPIFQANSSYFDIAIGQSFISTWDLWANGTNIGHRSKIRELKNELKELFGFNHFDMSVSTDKTNLIIETDNGTFYLDELGGGIGHFILVLGSALIKQPAFILIDEPENALHPKMQETFVQTLASKARYGVIATSHSIGLARSTADHIYSLSKDNNNKLSLANYGDNYTPSLINSMSELGYSQFVEIGGNHILLVEGRTDIKSFREILRKYKIAQHFIIMDLGGSNFVNGNSYEELSELKRLNARSYTVIFDSEIEEEGQVLKEKLQSFKDICVSLGFNVFTTEVHSTDNYISQEAIDAIMGSGYTKLDKYESLETRGRTNKWGKTLNWKMFREMKREDFIGTKLNLFIEDVLIPLIK